MRSAYKYLAGAIPVLVVIQAATIAFAFFGVTKWVEDGGTLDKATMEADPGPSFIGEAGFTIHGISGQLIIPLVALVLLIVSFFAKVPGGSKWAAFVLLDVVLQVVFAFTAFGAPVVGLVHGFNAFVLAGLGYAAYRAAATAPAVAASADGLRAEPA